MEELSAVDEETDRFDGTVARSYGCVFCKRGFTTAQALGGHMNIHRKDRAKNRPSSLPPPMVDESYGSMKLSGLEPHQQVRYPVYSPAAASTWEIARLSYQLPSIQSDRDFFAEECWRQTQNLMTRRAMIGDKKRIGMGGVEEDIDLELRLGYI